MIADYALKQGWKRVYIAVSDDAAAARRRLYASLERLYGRRSDEVEAAAIAGTPEDCAAKVAEVATAGAGLILFTPMFEQAQQAERLAVDRKSVV